MGTITRLNTAKKKLAQAEQAMPGAYPVSYTHLTLPTKA